LQLDPKLLPYENELPPVNLDANVEIFLVMFWLAQEGQEISEILPVLNTSFSNGFPQSAHTYSKMGIFFLRYKNIQKLSLQALIKLTGVWIQIIRCWQPQKDTLKQQIPKT
jgi:hypothetical protein